MPSSQPKLHLLGVRFQDAPVEVRESLVLNHQESLHLHQSVVQEVGEFESMVLSTCNRTEFFLAGDPQLDLVTPWVKHLKPLRPDAPLLSDSHHSFHLQDSHAVHHLFRVAGGLESAILGDSQILGQLKQMIQFGGDLGTIGDHLTGLGQAAIRAGKRIRSETAIGEGSASIGSAIAELVGSRIPEITHPRVLILGAGETAHNTAMHLNQRLQANLVFVNRTFDRAAALARQVMGLAIEWSRLKEQLIRADVVITTTSCPKILLSAETLRSLFSDRECPLLVDAGVPRNIESCDGFPVWNIDQIRSRQSEVLERRRQALPKAEEIVWSELDRWTTRQANRPIEDFIRKIYEQARLTSSQNAAGLSLSLGISAIEAERILFNSLSGALMPHARQLRLAAAHNRLNESAPVSAALAMAELAGLN